jgi:hypothetical protein
MGKGVEGSCPNIDKIKSVNPPFDHFIQEILYTADGHFQYAREKHRVHSLVGLAISAHWCQRARSTFEDVVMDHTINISIIDAITASTEQLQSLINRSLCLFSLLIHLFANIQTRVFPHIRLHTHTVVSVLLQETQPNLHNFGVSILNLNQSPQCDTLKVLLTLLVYEVGSGNGPALGDLGERYGAPCRKIEVVGSAEGKVGEEFEVAHTVGTELEVGGGDTVGRCALEGLKVVEVDRTRETKGFELALDFWAEERLASW